MAQIQNCKISSPILNSNVLSHYSVTELRQLAAQLGLSISSLKRTKKDMNTVMELVIKRNETINERTNIINNQIFPSVLPEPKNMCNEYIKCIADKLESIKKLSNFETNQYTYF